MLFSYIVANVKSSARAAKGGNNKWQKYMSVKMNHWRQRSSVSRDPVPETALSLKYVKESITKSLR